MNTREGFLVSDYYYDDVTLWICHYQGPIWVTVAFKCHITTHEQQRTSQTRPNVLISSW